MFSGTITGAGYVCALSTVDDRVAFSMEFLGYTWSDFKTERGN